MHGRLKLYFFRITVKSGMLHGSAASCFLLSAKIVSEHLVYIDSEYTHFSLQATTA